MKKKKEAKTVKEVKEDKEGKEASGAKEKSKEAKVPGHIQNTASVDKGTKISAEKRTNEAQAPVITRTIAANKAGKADAKIISPSLEIHETGERLEGILNHPLFVTSLKRIDAFEKSSKYCRHGMVHLLDTARIAYILNLENGLGISKEIIYATGILHDVGKINQYTQGFEHHVVGAALSRIILKDTGFNDSEIELITQAILSHRDARVKTEASLRGIIYRADKLSRPCFACKAEKKCDWNPEKKNRLLNY